MLVVLFFYSCFRLFVFNEFYPHSLLLIGTLLAIGCYIGLSTIKKMKPGLYMFLSCLGLFNLFLLLADYYYPEILRSTWNISFAFLFLLLFASLLFNVYKLESIFSKITFWICVATGFLIETGLLLKISLNWYYSVVSYILLIATILLFILYILHFRKLKSN